jgi:hypothetical protein
MLLLFLIKWILKPAIKKESSINYKCLLMIQDEKKKLSHVCKWVCVCSSRSLIAVVKSKLIFLSFVFKTFLKKMYLTQGGYWYRMLMIQILLGESFEDAVKKLLYDYYINGGKIETEWCFVAMLLLKRIISKSSNKSPRVCKIEREIWKKMLKNSITTPIRPFKQQQNIAQSHFFLIVTSFLEDTPNYLKYVAVQRLRFVSPPTSRLILMIRPDIVVVRAKQY